MKNFNSHNMADDNYHTSQSNLTGQQLAATTMANQAELAAGQNGEQSGSRRLLAPSSAGQEADDMQQELNYLSRDAPLDGGESTFGAATSYSQLAGAGGREESVLHMGSDLQDSTSHLSERHLRAASPAGYNYNEQALNQLSADNVDIQRPLQQAG